MGQVLQNETPNTANFQEANCNRYISLTCFKEKEKKKNNHGTRWSGSLIISGRMIKVTTNTKPHQSEWTSAQVCTSQNGHPHKSASSIWKTDPEVEGTPYTVGGNGHWQPLLERTASACQKKSFKTDKPSIPHPHTWAYCLRKPSFRKTHGPQH